MPGVDYEKAAGYPNEGFRGTVGCPKGANEASGGSLERRLQRNCEIASLLEGLLRKPSRSSQIRTL